MRTSRITLEVQRERVAKFKQYLNEGWSMSYAMSRSKLSQNQYKYLKLNDSELIKKIREYKKSKISKSRNSHGIKDKVKCISKTETKKEETLLPFGFVNYQNFKNRMS